MNKEMLTKWTEDKFRELYNTDIKKHTESVDIGKRTLTYLSWSQGYKMMTEMDINSKMEFVKNIGYEVINGEIKETESYLFPETTRSQQMRTFKNTKKITKAVPFDTVEMKEVIEKQIDPVTKEEVEVKVWKEFPVTRIRTEKELIEEETEQLVMIEKTTYFVKVRVTLFGEMKEMVLPVMDAKYNSCVTPTTRDIGDSLVRCFVKCLALFGLGLPLYNKEDLDQFIVKDERTVELENLSKMYHNNKSNPTVREKIGAFTRMCNKNMQELDLSEIRELTEMLKKLGC
jgi:hypothetical protein